MNLSKDKQDNRRLQEIDKAFHLRFGGETNIEDWSLDNFDINTAPQYVQEAYAAKNMRS